MKTSPLRNRGEFNRLLKHLSPYSRMIGFSALLFAGVAAINLAILWNVRILVDKVMVHRDLSAISSIIWILLSLFFVQTLLSMVQSYTISWVGQKLVTDFKISLFSALENLSLGFFSKTRTGEIISRLTNDVGVIQKISTSIPTDLAKHLVTLVGGLAVLFYMNWRLCMVTLGMIPFLILVARFFGKKLKNFSSQLQDRYAENSTLLEEVFSGIRIVKSFVREEDELRRFTGQVNSIFNLSMQKSRVLALFVPVITFLTLSAAAMVLWYGSLQILDGKMTPGDLIAFVLYGGILMLPFSAFARIFSQLKEIQGATSRVFELLDLKPQVTENREAQPLGTIAGRVSFKNVNFSYDSGHEVLKEISFEVECGQIVALVGPSGGGKTTLVNLLHRFYDPRSGRIEIDGREISKVNLKELYSQIGLVPQETLLFGGTIRENILYGKLQATDEEFLSASRGAHVDEFVQTLPMKYETVVGERGVNLSGGQRQRIAIARAILKNPRILILDEATSALDTESEMLIQDALDHFMANRTTFVIAHRLSTIQSAHLILVIDKGRIMESGTHLELLKREGLYYRLYTMKLSGMELVDQAVSPKSDL
ncbi:MAG: ABC transporter ATP-binding protein [Nitrospirae bacterium]|nr:ABC transporter ATP-binding protein [Nitrospirota bacterium]